MNSAASDSYEEVDGTSKIFDEISRYGDATHSHNVV